jgi:hypothetical protein
MNRLEALCEKIEDNMDEVDRLREGCEIVGLEKLAADLSIISMEIKQHLAALRAEARPKRVRSPKLVFSSVKRG